MLDISILPKQIIQLIYLYTYDTIVGFNQARTWGMKKKLAPKNTIEPPAAKKDEKGNLVSSRKGLESLYLKTYKSRLEPNPIAKDQEELKSFKEYLLDIRMKLAKSEITDAWTEDDLTKAVKSFKNNKARDEHGHT